MQTKGKCKRATLNQNQVLMIHAIKKNYIKSLRGKAAMIGSLVGVSEKAIRDIWCGRTWCRVTGMPRKYPAVREILGRPKGSKDKIPRRQKAHKGMRARLERFRRSTIDRQLLSWTRSRFVSPHLFTDDSIDGLD